MGSVRDISTSRETTVPSCAGFVIVSKCVSLNSQIIHRSLELRGAVVRSLVVMSLVVRFDPGLLKSVGWDYKPQSRLHINQPNYTIPRKLNMDFFFQLSHMKSFRDFLR